MLSALDESSCGCSPWNRPSVEDSLMLPAALPFATAMVGNCVSALRWHVVESDIDTETSQPAISGSGDTLLECLNSCGEGRVKGLAV